MPQDSLFRTSRQLAAPLVVAIAAAMFLSSCAGSTPADPPATDDVSPTQSASETVLTPIDAGEGVPGTPADQGEPFDGTGPSTIYDPAAPEALTVVLFGSGSCPPEPVSYSVGDDGKVTILTDYVGTSEMCTKDFSPITYEIATPPEFDPTKGVALEAVQPN
jgi:hypothetical protein